MTNQMSSVARIVEYTGNQVGKQVWTWCPGCHMMHPFTIESDGKLNKGTTWQWNGDLEKPTFSPSLLCYNSVHLCEGEHDPEICWEYPDCEVRGHSIGAEVDGEIKWVFPNDDMPEKGQVYGHGQPHTREPAWGNCHSFLQNGMWQFLGDSAHSLAGKTVPMVPLPGWYARKWQE